MVQGPPNISIDAIWDATPAGMLLVDAAGTILWNNAELEQQLGYQPGELQGLSVEALVPEASQALHREHRASYQEAPRRRAMGAGRRLSARRKDGSSIPTQISLSPLETPEGTMTVAAVQDVSAHADSESRLDEARRERAVAQERDRIARELHDTVIQHLFAIGMSLQAVQSEARPEAVERRVGQAVDGLDATIAEIRSAIFGLHSQAADTSIRTAVRELCHALHPSLGFEPDVILVGPVDSTIPDHVAEHVIPTVQEALTNVARHAQATSAEVRIEVNGDVLVEVIDNGRGIPPNTQSRRGLANLAERAELLEGTFAVEAHGGGGTRLQLRVPL